MKKEIGNGWVYDAELDIYSKNNGEFMITADIVRNGMKNWGRKIENIHILAVLDKLEKNI